MKTVTTWSCRGPATVPPQPCDAHGTKDSEAERHARESGHTTHCVTKPVEEKR